MFNNCLYFNTSALARQLEREWSEAFKPFGLTPPQGFMLRAVLDNEGLLQREVAEALKISRPTATRALDGLQAKGYIIRKSSSEDGRECSIYPTVKAYAIKDPLNQRSGVVTARLKKLLGNDEFNDAVMKIKNISAVLK